MPQLELNLSPQLNHPLRDIGAESRPENAGRGLLQVVDLAECLVRHPIVGIRKIRMIEEIEKLRADRQHGIFPVVYLRVFYDREVAIEVIRSSKTIATLCQGNCGATARS